MDEMLIMSKELYSDYLNDEEQKLINILKENFIANEPEYNLDELWKYDSFLGGIGCYSMPADPKKNPFTGGYVRYVFRPLQYVRCSMEILNLNYTARDAIRDTGLHLEFVMKFLLKKNRRILSIVNSKLTLGKLIYKLNNINVISDEQLKYMKLLIELYNKSKHEINIDDNRSMSFTPIDAIIFYIVSRKISVELLKPYYEKIYQDFGNRLQYFCINYQNKRDYGFVK